MRAAVVDALRLYYVHSAKQGMPYYSQAEALSRLDDIKRRFWDATTDYVKTEWPWQWRSKMQDLQKSKLPDTERERILNLKRTRQ